MSMTPVTNLGEARRREEAARKRGERYKVDPLVREQRAALQDARDAALAQDEAAVAAKQQAKPDAILGVLQHASEAELAEFARVAGQVDPRRLVEIASDLLRQRQRSRKAAPQEAQEAPEAAKASSSTRTR